MSAFAQHDEIDAIVEGGECAFCDTPALVRVDGDFVEGVYQLLQIEGAPLYLCGSHWLTATQNADRADITHCDGINTFYVPA